jgi:hypothetical protein
MAAGWTRGRGLLVAMTLAAGAGIGVAIDAAQGAFSPARSAPAIVYPPPVTAGDVSAVASRRAGLRVLLIGNSFTAANAMIDTLSALARQDRGARPIFAVEYAPSASTLSQAAANPGLIDLLTRYHWDDVVLQEHSRIPQLPDSLRSLRQASLSATGRLGSLIKGDGAHAIMLETWGYRDGDALDWQSDSYAQMSARLRAGYAQLAAAAGAVVAPVGDSWRLALAQDPRLPLWARDGEHPSVLGSYLTACVLYGVLESGRAAGSTYAGGLGATAAELRATADAGLASAGSPAAAAAPAAPAGSPAPATPALPAATPSPVAFRR